jgi:hypothetical protein
LGAQAIEQDDTLEARVWLDRGAEPMLKRGDRVRIYYRTSQDAYGAIFHIDTDGVVSMVFPHHPGATAPVAGGRDYRLLFPGTAVWTVKEDPGVGYFFMLASSEALDFSSFTYDERWELGAVGSVVYEDPYVAIDAYVAELIPDWEVVPYALDFVTYHVGATHAYPRFLCYDCHAYRPYALWNPYELACASFRIVIWNDPYFDPVYRHSGIHVAVARPARAFPRYELVTRVAGDIGVRPIVRQRVAPRPGEVDYKEEPAGAARLADRASGAARARADMETFGRAGGVGARTILAAPQQAPTPRAGQQVPDSAGGRPTLQRRPSARLPARTPPSSATPRTGSPAPGRTVAPPAPARETPSTEPPSPRPQSSGTSPLGSGARPAPESGPERRGVRAVPAAPQGARAAPSRAPAARPDARSSNPPNAGLGPAPRGPAARSSPPPASRNAEPATRAPAPRATVRPRPPEPN